VYPLGVRGTIGGRPYEGTHKPGATTAASWQSDNAVDIYVPVGTPVFAVVTGKVVRVHDQHGQYTEGWTVTIAGKGNQFFYAHLTSASVKAGQTIRAGQIIGKSGSANGADHLHFAMEHGNPVAWIKGKPIGPGHPGAPGRPAGGGAVSTLQYQQQPWEGQGVPGMPGMPGTEPLTGVQLTPPSIANMWNSLANLPQASPETRTFAQRASMWGGG
jgi:murein DD-endopeptidase MepM/ murein hydrolase activator NlpD